MPLYVVVFYQAKRNWRGFSNKNVSFLGPLQRRDGKAESVSKRLEDLVIAIGVNADKNP